MIPRALFFLVNETYELKCRGECSRSFERFGFYYPGSAGYRYALDEFYLELPQSLCRLGGCLN